jgi:cytochrome P450 family 6
MNKDSSYFPDRGLHVNGHFDPISEQIFFQGGEKWKKLRVKLTPAFTSGKLKAMLSIVTKNLLKLEEFIKKGIKEGAKEFEFRDLVARMNTNIISSVAFGIEVDTINDPQHVMRHMGVKVFEPNLIAGLRFFTSFFTPKLSDLFRFKFVNDEIESFFSSIIVDNVNYREENNFHRNDLLQTLIQLKNFGFMADEDKIGEKQPRGDMNKISISDVCGQSFGFYLGGE